MIGKVMETTLREQRLNALITSFLNSCQEGCAPDRQELLARHPDLATELQAFFVEHDRWNGVAPGPGFNTPLREAASQISTSSDDLGKTPPPQASASQLFGDYELLTEIGSGGMGHVFKARHKRLNRFVALKFIRADLMTHPEAVRRFQREARAAARLTHPNIVSIYDADEVDGLHFLAMEFVEGDDLAGLVQKRGPLPIAEACQYLRQVALGLQHAFERGLVHRDIKPSNLIVAQSGESGSTIVKILDLGLARVHRAAEGSNSSVNSLTGAGAVVGTPDYIAPEQVEDPHSADIRADLYSLGCTFYYLLTGQVPFPGGTMIQKLDKHRWEAPRPVQQLRPDVPPALLTVIRRLLAKKPAERYQTPAEVASAVDLYCLPVGSEARPHVTNVTVHETEQETRTFLQLLEEPAPLAPPPGARSEVHCLSGHQDGVTSLVFSKDGRFILSGSRDFSVRLWDVEQRQELFSLAGHRNWVTSVALSPDGSRAYSAGADHTVRLWDLVSRQQIAQTTDHIGEVWATALAPDGGHFLAGGKDQLVRLFDAANGREVRQFGGRIKGRHWDAVYCLAFAPDGRLALSGSRDQSLRLWDVATGQEVRTFLGHKGSVHCVTFLPDGRRALSCGDTTLRLWDLESGWELGCFQGHTDVVTSVAVTPDGRRALSGGKDQTARLWDVSRAQELHCFEDHPHRIMQVALSPDGRHAISGSGDRIIRLWELPE